MKKHNERVVTILTLFTSSGTLICCALPALFVTIGAGAALAGIVSSFPELVFFSKHKIWVFLISGLLICLSGYLRYRSKYLVCPVDKNQAEACSAMKKSSFYIYYFSVIIYLVGFFFAFVAPHIF
jgi:hypothetical protein